MDALRSARIRSKGLAFRSNDSVIDGTELACRDDPGSTKTLELLGRGGGRCEAKEIGDGKNELATLGRLAWNGRRSRGVVKD